MHIKMSIEYTEQIIQDDEFDIIDDDEITTQQQYNMLIREHNIEIEKYKAEIDGYHKEIENYKSEKKELVNLLEELKKELDKKDTEDNTEDNNSQDTEDTEDAMSNPYSPPEFDIFCPKYPELVKYCIDYRNLKVYFKNKHGQYVDFTMTSYTDCKYSSDVIARDYFDGNCTLSIKSYLPKNSCGYIYSINTLTIYPKYKKNYVTKNGYMIEKYYVNDYINDDDITYKYIKLNGYFKLSNSTKKNICEIIFMEDNKCAIKEGTLYLSFFDKYSCSEGISVSSTYSIKKIKCDKIELITWNNTCI